MNLQSHILERLYSKDLVDIQNQVPTIHADAELANRLRAGDLETLLALQNIREMTPRLRQAVRDYPMPWRIGIIYNPTTGQIVDIQAAVGEYARKRYRVKGQPVKFSWLDTERHGWVLYEVNNFIEASGRHKIDHPEVLPALLNHDKDEIFLVLDQLENPQTPTYTNDIPLSKGENYRYVPAAIKTNSGFLKLQETRQYLFKLVEGSLEMSPEVAIYHSLMNR